MALSSSTRLLASHGYQYIQRQSSDLYVKEARRLGYVCRSAFKLSHIDDQCKLFDSNTTSSVVDLGASPGSWCQIIRQRTNPQCRIVGIDLLPIRVNLPGAVFLQGDVSAPATQRKLAETLGTSHMDKNLDVVTSDMCPNRSGGRDDRQRSAALNEIALFFALQQLKVGGNFVCKVLGSREGNFEQLYLQMQSNFNQVRFIKPPASRSESDESFLVGLGRLSAPKSIGDRRVALNQMEAVRRGKPLATGRIDYGLDDWPGARRR